MQEEIKPTPPAPEPPTPPAPETPTPPPATPTPAAPPSAPAPDQKDIEENKGIAVLSYIGILCLVPLLAKKESKFAQYHAKQGLILFIAEIAMWIVGIILAFIPIVGWIINFALWIFLLILAIMGIINVVQGQYKELPVLGKLGEKFKF